MAKIKIDSNLFDRARKASESAGYSSVEEFIAHIVETETAKYEQSDAEDQTRDQLRGLGYVD